MRMWLWNIPLKHLACETVKVLYIHSYNVFSPLVQELGGVADDLSVPPEESSTPEQCLSKLIALIRYSFVC